MEMSILGENRERDEFGNYGFPLLLCLPVPKFLGNCLTLLCSFHLVPDWCKLSSYTYVSQYTR